MNALDAHFASAWRVLASHNPRGVVDARDGVEVTAAGAGGAAFNQAWVVDPPATPSETVAWARDALAATARPYCLQVPAPFLASVAPVLAGGMRPAGTMPGMVRPAADEEPALPEGLRLVPVRDPAELETFAVAMATGFGSPEPRDAVDALAPACWTTSGSCC